MLHTRFDNGDENGRNKGWYFIRIVGSKIYWETIRFRTKLLLYDTWAKSKLKMHKRDISVADENRMDSAQAQRKAPVVAQQGYIL